MAAEGSDTLAGQGPIARSGAFASLWGKAKAFAQRWPGVTSGLLGLVSALGFPPIHAWWIALPGLALWIAHLRSASGWKGALWIGWTFGWAHLTLANNWIATAFTYQAKMPEALGWAAVPLLCIYLAVYPALAALAAHMTGRWNGRRSGTLAFGAVLAAAWIATEWLRSWVFTGYPWPPLGLMLLGGWEEPGWARFLPWLGTYALSGIAIILATYLVAASTVKLPSRWHRAAAFLGVAAIVAGPMLLRVQSDGETDIQFTLVQPLIPQEEINDGSKFEEQFQRIARLTQKNADQSRLVLWPESAVPDYLEEGYPQRYYTRMTAGADPDFARRRIGMVIGPQSTLLTGVVNLNIGPGTDGIPRALSARNSVIAMNGEGEITDHYAKAHLVPYGEYLPLEDVLGAIGLSRLTAGTVPYIPGPGPQTLDLGEHGKAGIQICYEIVFSGQVVDQENRPDYLFNPSNDGWFGTWGPPQHLAQARMRAIEEGLPVLRSTTTGISAVIDADGIVRDTVASGEADALEGLIPSAKTPTLFSQLGNTLPLMWAGLLALLGLGMPRLLALRNSRG
ncbi:apolipoprotein N-acyltransferase [uncultured Erythrobacter sp.]|uniref:apolipoprotein N-acyltransferase n=1 Tax=uncultured Erythrobacter sp. TaxID=263913 RepID=UPI00261B4D51|nr:apolipoprotein N-acyltransferase [uncultured Erythrobacter sp.]